MNPLHRRGFLGTSLGLTAAFAAGPIALGAEAVPVKPRTGFRPDTLFLTWQKDPTTTMTVQWVGREGECEDPTIYYTAGFPATVATTAVRTVTKPFPLGDLKVFRAELTGLTPNTEYLFNIGKNSPTFKFRTMPAKATNEINFISGGDCGVGPHTVANNKVAAKQDPRFVIIGGDLAYDNGVAPKTTLDWLRQYSLNMIDSADRLIPMIVCIGNHEVKGGWNKHRKDAPMFFALFDGLFSQTSYAALDFGDYLSIVLMDTGHTCKVAGAQTDWLDKTLAQRLDRQHLLVVNHVPAFPSVRSAVIGDTVDGKAGSGVGEDQRKNWVPLFEKYNVDAVLEHHDHCFKRTHALMDGHKDKNGIVYLGDGSWGKIRTPTKPESRSYIAKASFSYHLTLHSLQDDVRYHMAIEENGKIVDITHTGKKPRRRG